MPLSYILLSITGLVVLFGFAHRVLDRMKMTDTWAFFGDNWDDYRDINT